MIRCIDAHKNHRLDNAGLHLVGHGLSGAARRTARVCRHYSRLTTQDDQYAPVAEDEDQYYNDVEGQELPDRTGHASCLTFPEKLRITDACSTCSNGHHVSYEITREDFKIFRNVLCCVVHTVVHNDVHMKRSNIWMSVLAKRSWL